MIKTKKIPAIASPLLFLGHSYFCIVSNFDIRASDFNTAFSAKPIICDLAQRTRISILNLTGCLKNLF
jgi:hypothetical protein